MRHFTQLEDSGWLVIKLPLWVHEQQRLVEIGVCNEGFTK